MVLASATSRKLPAGESVASPTVTFVVIVTGVLFAVVVLTVIVPEVDPATIENGLVTKFSFLAVPMSA
jgi:hypothetical protein